ncbi:MAG: hypothetical protein OXG61_00830 [Chloroflexi bacterium]|nr:hypothetical protein [Chloroflexota bacterium]
MASTNLSRLSAKRRAWLIGLGLVGASGVVLAVVLLLTGGERVQRATATSGCESGTAVSDPANNPGLVADCKVLLALRDELRGSGSLNWSTETPIARWSGVTLDGTPQRVALLRLFRAGLNGSIPAGLGKLPMLRHIDLRYNQLSGAIPTELGSLTKLTVLRLTWNALTGSIPAGLAELPLIGLQLSGNQLSGCVPPDLRKVRNNDLSQISLSDCTGDEATPTATATPTTASATPTPTATATPTATPPPASGPLTLMVISDGAADALTLEWTGGPSNATKWQYRVAKWNQATYRLEMWSAWTDVPNSTASTTSYRLKGLDVYTGYHVEVRPVVSKTPGPASETILGATQYAAGSGKAPEIEPGQVVEGDGVTKWRLHRLPFVFVIPDGMRLEGGVSGITEDEDIPGVAVFEVNTGSYLMFDMHFGYELQRGVNQPVASPDGAGGQQSSAPDISAQFDQIAASVERD